jgi:hypothetical protein
MWLEYMFRTCIRHVLFRGAHSVYIYIVRESDATNVERVLQRHVRHPVQVIIELCCIIMLMDSSVIIKSILVYWIERRYAGYIRLFPVRQAEIYWTTRRCHVLSI